VDQGFQIRHHAAGRRSSQRFTWSGRRQAHQRLQPAPLEPAGTKKQWRARRLGDRLLQRPRERCWVTAQVEQLLRRGGREQLPAPGKITARVAPSLQRPPPGWSPRFSRQACLSQLLAAVLRSSRAPPACWLREAASSQAARRFGAQAAQQRGRAGITDQKRLDFDTVGQIQVAQSGRG